MWCPVKMVNNNHLLDLSQREECCTDPIMAVSLAHHRIRDIPMQCIMVPQRGMDIFHLDLLLIIMTTRQLVETMVLRLVLLHYHPLIIITVVKVAILESTIIRL